MSTNILVFFQRFAQKKHTLRLNINFSSFMSTSNADRARYDILQGLCAHRVWLMLSWQDIKMRYRRSTLGPFWITLSMALTITAIAVLYGQILKVDLKHYYPFLASGLLTWGLISSLLTDGSTIFIEAEGFLKQMKQPYFLFVLRSVSKNFIIFFHNLCIFPFVMFFSKVPVNIHTLWLLPALLLIWVNALSFGTMLAVIGARFRDIAQLVNSLVQIVFFITPIIWPETLLPASGRFWTNFNPVAHYVSLLRQPMLGLPIPHLAWGVTLTVTAIGLFISYVIFKRCRVQIIYWL